MINRDELIEKIEDILLDHLPYIEGKSEFDMLRIGIEASLKAINEAGLAIVPRGMLYKIGAEGENILQDL